MLVLVLIRDMVATVTPKTKIIFFVLLILFVLGAYVSYLTIESHLSEELGLSSSAPLCNISAGLNCKAVIDSEYSTLFGRPLGVYGVGFYGIFALIFLQSLLTRKIDALTAIKFYALPSIFSLIGSAVLFLISKFLIGVLCPLCLTLYSISLVGTVLALCALPDAGLVGKLKASINFWFEALVEAFKDFKTLLARSFFELLLFSMGLILIVTWSSFLPNIISWNLINDYSSWPTNQKLKIDLKLDGSAWGDYYKGEVNAPIEIVKFIDFECPACRKLSAEIDSALLPYWGQYLVVLKNYPLDSACNPSMMAGQGHKQACLSAAFLRCAGEQQAFWKAEYDLLALPDSDFKLSQQVFTERLMQIALGLKLDTVAIKECLDSGRQMSAIINDIKQGDLLKIAGTPSVYVNGKKLDSSSASSVALVVKELIAKNGNKK